MKYIDYQNREEWLKGRINSLGASEVASVLGMGFQTTLELWKVKTKQEAPKDLSFHPRVKYGIDSEEHLRALFALKNADKYQMRYEPYRTYFHVKHDFLSCTLDGILVSVQDQENGVWECKTVWVTSKKSLEEWSGCIPNKYYCQVCEQLSITGYKFAVVTVELIFPDGNSEIRNITIDRNAQVEKDIDYITQEAVKFWEKYVIPGKRPPVKMVL